MQLIVLDPTYIEQVKGLWERDFLGIPYNNIIEEMILQKRFIGIVDEGKLLAMCGYKRMKRTNEIQVVKLCVGAEYRNQGYALRLVKVIKELAREEHKTLTAHCRDEAPNNTFYDRIGTLMKIEPRKTMKVRVYVINRI